MSLIELEGLNEQTILNTDTTPSGGGLRPFPCDAAGWTKQTAVVMQASIKTFDDGQESISILVANGQYGGEVLISLDPKGAPDVQKALDTRNKAIKILGAVTDGKLDTDKLKKAHGQLIEVIAKHKGFRQGKDGRDYHKISLVLTGEVPALRDVVMVEMPALPAASAASVDQDIPF